jgi:acetyl esterase
MRVSGEPMNYEGDFHESRRRLDRTGPLLGGSAGRRVATRELTIPGAAGPLHSRLYLPSRAPLAGLPVLVWFHGGGYVLGSMKSHDGVCRNLAALAEVAVISVAYRLAPEHRFPAGVEDALAATRWVLDSGGGLGLDPCAVAVGGDSAGGTLAAVVAQSLRGAVRQPVFQLLIYPPTDATRSYRSHQTFAEGFILDERSIDWFLQHYLPDQRLIVDPRISPLLADDISGVCPALVLTAGFDPLRDEGRAYAARLSAAGVAASHVGANGSLHGFLHTDGALTESARMLRLAARAVREALTARSPDVARQSVRRSSTA